MESAFQVAWLNIIDVTVSYGGGGAVVRVR